MYGYTRSGVAIHNISACQQCGAVVAYGIWQQKHAQWHREQDAVSHMLKEYVQPKLDT